MNSKPTGVLVIAVLHALFGLLMLAAAVWMYMVVADTSRLPFIGADIAKYWVWAAVIVTAMGAGYLATAWGLWELRRWAQVIAITLSGISLFFDVASVLLLSSAGGGVPITAYLIVALYAAVSGGIIFYLLMPQSAAFFVEGITMPVSNSCPHCFQAGVPVGASVCPFCRCSLYEAPAPPPSTPPVPLPRRQERALETRLEPPRASVRGWLMVKSGPGAGSMLDLDDDTDIGRDGTCQISLEDDYVSRSHARVKFENGQFYIYDLGSKGGTYVNDQRIQRYMLFDGAQIRLGQTMLEFKQTAPVR